MFLRMTPRFKWEQQRGCGGHLLSGGMWKEAEVEEENPELSFRFVEFPESFELQ